ncbi:TIGR01777 family oxidoreductase [Salinispirillum sp. LH 10-3-1]|uniref:TIGR01777 family oxidoreductase n=1 Tax=Salinispirillum sp. LH 10-3-1 TaxID=2952525 RepID=A0AB38YFG5_9GAMM
MRILITGGSGFLGQALAKDLQQHGHDVVILSRQPEQQARRATDTAALWVGSLDDIKEPVEAVVNLTGANLFALPWTEGRKATLWQSRVTLTEQLVAWMLKQPVPPHTLLSGSAIGFYGDAGDQPLTEDSPVGSDWAASMVAAWERATEPAAQAGIRTLNLRTGLVLGNGGLLKPLLPLFKAGLGGSLGNGQFWYSWIHLDDWVAAVVALLGTPEAKGPYNLTAPHPVRYREFADTLGATLHRPVWLTPPAWVLKPLLGQRAALMLSSTRALPHNLTTSGFQWQYDNLQEALENL